MRLFVTGEPTPRSRRSRKAAEESLLRILIHYGQRPEFVVLGGLVPDLLCADSQFLHAGTTDVDVQVDLEIACGLANGTRLENALRESGFVPDGERSWRWVLVSESLRQEVKIELLADLESERAGSTVEFNDCNNLGAINLRGTGFASRDFEVHELSASFNGDIHRAEINVAGLAGFLLSKAAAAYSRQLPKDWYDIAYVLMYNNAGGPVAAAEHVQKQFAGKTDAFRSSLRELQANFADSDAQGTQAFVQQFQADNPESDPDSLATDAVLAVEEFCNQLLEKPT